MSINRRRFLGACAAGAGVTLLGGGASVAAARRPLPDLVRASLDRGLTLGFPGMVCGVLADGKSYVAGAGRTGAGPGKPNGRTVFQIGSITKTFTGLHLAIAEELGLAGRNDPLARHLPKDWSVPGAGDRPIRLVDLATHASGLPALPPNLQARPDFDPRNPYAGYTMAQLADGLAATELAHRPGTTYGYSNFAFGLLGEVLSGRLGGYEPLLRAVTLPLGMVDTTLTLSAPQRRRKAVGHDLDGNPVPDWTGQVLTGAGVMTYGTADDLVRYLRAQLNPEATPFARSIRLTQREHFVDGPHRMGLGWERAPLPSGHTMVWKNGGTGGFSSFAAFCPESRVAVAMINNAVQPADQPVWPLDSLGVDLLRGLDER